MEYVIRAKCQSHSGGDCIKLWTCRSNLFLGHHGLRTEWLLGDNALLC